MARPTLLLVNKFYHDVGPAGGVGRYLLQEEEDLAARGWRVVPFAMADEHARRSAWERYFVRARDYRRPRWSASAPGDALSLIWNREAARNLEALIAAARPDAVHLHNVYHHLSPSILPVLRRHRLPVVMTLHDLRLLCPAIHMLRRGEVCERCRGGRFHQAVLGPCVKDSRPASLLAALETAHHTWRRLYPATVARFLCPSAFYVAKYREWGFPAERLEHLPNFVDLAAWRPLPRAAADGCLYFGRLSREKGLATLLRAHARWTAARAAAGGSPPPPLRLAGSGPQMEELRRLAAGLPDARIEFLGPLAPDDLRREIARARFTVLPSEWYENGPLALLESLAAGVPVVGAAIGGIPEHLRPGRNGVLFAPGDEADLARALDEADRLPATARAEARLAAEQLYGRRGHMDRLEAVLGEAIAQRASGPPR
jgi:glycosyltransferase involved in cell wall biosynthesis